MSLHVRNLRSDGRVLRMRLARTLANWLRIVLECLTLMDCICSPSKSASRSHFPILLRVRQQPWPSNCMPPTEPDRTFRIRFPSLPCQERPMANGLFLFAVTSYFFLLTRQNCKNALTHSQCSKRRHFWSWRSMMLLFFGGCIRLDAIAIGLEAIAYNLASTHLT